jgi:hypothetical protein
VVEELAVERQLQVQLAARESEALGHHRARLLGAGRQRSVLHLFTNQIINFFSKVSSLYVGVLYIPYGWPSRRTSACGSDHPHSHRRKS